MTTLPVRADWYRRRSVGDGVTRLDEPAVDPLLRCNIWHVRGRDRDLLVDTGLGIVGLAAEIADLTDKPLTVVATHIHLDHTGNLHEFGTRLIHQSEAPLLEKPDLLPLERKYYPQEIVDDLAAADYELPEILLTEVPDAAFRLDQFSAHATTATATLSEGDVVDLGDRAFEVLHLPGHSPGSIGLLDPVGHTLFSGDAVYDGPLLDGLPESDVDDYRQTMRRLSDLPVSVVHAGHEESFGPDRLRQLCSEYLPGPNQL